VEDTPIEDWLDGVRPSDAPAGRHVPFSDPEVEFMRLVSTAFLSTCIAANQRDKSDKEEMAGKDRQPGR